MKEFPIFLKSGTAGEGKHDPEHPNHVYRPTGTTTWLLEYTVEGRGLAWCDGRELALSPGSFLLYEAGAPQDYDIDNDEGYWHHIWFCFDPRPHWLDWLHWPEVFPGAYLTRAPDEVQRERVLTEMQQALEIARSVEVHRRDLVLNILEKVLLYCDAWNPAGRAARRDERIQSVLEFVNDHIVDKLTVASLARVCSLSPSRLSHLFQEQMGQAPMQYVESRRIDLARELLMMTAKPIAQVAEECGFKSPFYFSRVFKAHTGLAPRSARQRYAK